MAEIRRSQHKNATRSRHLIKQAFGELLNEKPLAKITVTDIVERANISRGTFYAHYLDVYDLFNVIQNNLLETIGDYFDKLGIESIIIDPAPAIKTGMKILSENKTYFGLFMNSSYADRLVERVLQQIAEHCEALIEEHVPAEDRQEAKAFLVYTLGAYRGMLVQWFNGGLDATGEECANYLIDFYLRSRPKTVVELAHTLAGEKPEMIG